MLLYPEGSLPRHEVYFALMSFAYSHFTQWTLQVSPLPTETGLKGYLIEGFPTASDLKTFRERATSATGLLPALPEGSLLLPPQRGQPAPPHPRDPRRLPRLPRRIIPDLFPPPLPRSPHGARWKACALKNQPVLVTRLTSTTSRGDQYELL